jgi:hypothetical protein
VLYGKEKRQELLKERIDNVLLRLKEFEEQVETEEEPNKITKLESAIKKLKDRWKGYEAELNELNKLEEITTSNCSVQKYKNELDSDVAAALVKRKHGLLTKTKREVSNVLLLHSSAISFPPCHVYFLHPPARPHAVFHARWCHPHRRPDREDERIRHERRGCH